MEKAGIPAEFHTIISTKGHDSFLLEPELYAEPIRRIHGIRPGTSQSGNADSAALRIFSDIALRPPLCNNSGPRKAGTFRYQVPGSGDINRGKPAFSLFFYNLARRVRRAAALPVRNSSGTELWPSGT